MTRKLTNIRPGWTRRAAVKALSLLALWPVHGRAAVSGCPVRRGLEGVFNDCAAARAVGRTYLQGHPGDRPATERLGRRLEGAQRGGREPFNAEIRGLIADDFSAERTVVVDGWILARTEARLCALMVLS